MASAQSVIESFMSARTKLSHNASFGWNLYTLNFDVYGLVIGANIEVNNNSSAMFVEVYKVFITALREKSTRADICLPSIREYF